MATPSTQRALPEQIDLIAGQRRTPQLSGDAALADPNTGEQLADSLQSDQQSVEEAIASASRVHETGAWFGLSAEKRSAALIRFADALAERAPLMAEPESLNTGIPIGVTTPMTGGLDGFLRGAAERVAVDHTNRIEGRHGRVELHRLPFGPAVIIAPWNAPSPTVVGRTAAALAAGCPVIVKPSEWAPSTADIVAEAAHAADLPAGAFQLVHGGAAVGARLVGDPRVRVVSFTGGQVAGRSIAGAAAPNFTRLQLELGANNPAIVRADADVEATARSLAAGVTKLNGQWCEAPGRVLAHRSVIEELTEALKAALDDKRIGPSTDSATEIGPLSHKPHLDKICAAISAMETEGATVHRCGTLPDLGGWFLEPTVVTGLDADLALPETFGPVISLHTVDDDVQAVASANVGTDGLAAYVFGRDIDAAMAIGARLRAGEVKINGTGLFDLCGNSEQSFWGTSGIGGHGDEMVFELFRGSRIVGEDDPNAEM